MQMPRGERQFRRVRKRLFFAVEGDGEQAFCRWLQELCDEADRYLHLDVHNLCGGDPLKMVHQALQRRERGLQRGEYGTSVLLIDGDRLEEGNSRTVKTLQIVAQEGLQQVLNGLGSFGSFFLVLAEYPFPFPKRRRAGLRCQKTARPRRAGVTFRWQETGLNRATSGRPPDRRSQCRRRGSNRSRTPRRAGRSRRCPG